METTTEIKLASKRQLWALFCINKKDYRNENLTFEQASKMIAEANDNKPHVAKVKKSSIKDIILSQESIQKLTDCLIAQMGIQSIVMTDTSLLPDDGKRFLFFGGGCGFSYIRYDKRSKKAGAIIDEAKALKQTVDAKVRENLGKNVLDYLIKAGNPCQAHQFQNLAYADCFNSIITGYLNEQGIKCYIDSRLD